MNFKKFVTLAVAGVVGVLVSFSSMAIPITKKGAEITVSYAINYGVDNTGQTVSFDYLFRANDSSAFIGDSIGSLGIQFGGKKKASMLAGLSSTFTNPGDLLGTWAGKQGNVSGKGCSAGSNFFAVCYRWLPADPGGVDRGIVIAAGIDYLFQFDVTFADGVDVAKVLSRERPIKFSSVEFRTNKAGKNERWRKGTKLRGRGEIFAKPPIPSLDEGEGLILEEITFVTDANPSAVPLPGTLALSGLGLLALGWSRKRRPLQLTRRCQR